MDLYEYFKYQKFLTASQLCDVKKYIAFKKEHCRLQVPKMYLKHKEKSTCITSVLPGEVIITGLFTGYGSIIDFFMDRNRMRVDFEDYDALCIIMGRGN
jgi:hypothetical protein